MCDMFFSSESHTKGFLNNALYMVFIGSHTMTKLGVCTYIGIM